MAQLAVVTGASSGIGKAYAERLARDGWNLEVVARRRDRLEELAEELRSEYGADVRVIVADLASDDHLRAVTEELTRLPVELLVNNAALAHYMPFAELPADKADELVHVNVLAPVLLSRAVLSGMRERGTGAIINVASLLAFSGAAESPHLPARAVYASSKAFLVTFTQILAAELRDSGIRVQVVCPGVVRSEFHSRQGMDMSAVPRMEPEMIVQASLQDLERGVVVSMPGMSNERATEALIAAQGQIMRAARVTELAERYR